MVLKFALRFLKKRPVLNLIKIAGLSLALSCILFIVLFLKSELTFDRYLDNSNRIYRITNTSTALFSDKHFARIPNPGYIPDLAESFPEIENYARLSPIRGGVVKKDEKFYNTSQGFQCDSTFFEVFSCELLVGDPDNILNDPGSLVISESFSRVIFGDGSPIGQIITIPSGQFYGEDIEFTIKGIMKDFPHNSHFHPDFITTPIDKTIFQSWAWSYLLLNANSDPDDILSRFGEFYYSITGFNPEEVEVEAHLQKITDIHLHSHKLREIEANNSMSIIYTLAAAALILLLISLINYANLSMGMAGYSRKYFFISRVAGASRWMNLKHYLTMGSVILVVAVVISALIASIVNTAIQNYFGLDLLQGNLSLIIILILCFSLLSILSEILPILRSNKIKYQGKSLIVIQYAISIALIIAVLVIQRQTNYALDSSMGVDNERLICFEKVHSDVQGKFGIFKEELLKHNSIESVSAMFEPPGGEANDMFRFTLEGYLTDDVEEADNMIGIFPCDYSFASIFNLNFLCGRDFSEGNLDNEGAGEYIINMAALRRLNYANPDEIIGKDFQLLFHTPDIAIPKGTIIGVVEDFHLSSIKKEIEPLVLFKRESMWLMNFVVSYQDGLQEEGIEDMKSVWTSMFPEYAFQYSYISSMYEELYSSERLQARLLSIFTLIALFICSMGLLGMSLLTTQRRTKEIGIRKVNGATIAQIMLLLNWGFLKWILLSFILAIPLAYYGMNKWLENFAYKTNLSWWIFALAGLVAILIALITVSVQSWKAARSNPMEALRSE